ncbi:MAG: hypothetical protein ACYDAY_11960 [Candidatus Dormibacteria bacterium]
MVMMGRAEPSSALVVQVAANNPAFLALLVKFVRVSSIAQVGTIIGAWGIAVAVDIGRIPASSGLAQQILGEEISQLEEARRQMAAESASYEGPGQPNPA